MTPCEHVWEPCPGWTGRYRCRECLALAYKRFVTDDLVDGVRVPRRGGPAEMMVLYRCKKRGCEAPAISHRQHQLCRAHQPK